MGKDRKRAVGVQEPILAESAGAVCTVQSGVWPWKRCLSRHCSRQDSGLSYPCGILCVFSGLQMADLCACWKWCQQLCVLVFRRPPVSSELPGSHCACFYFPSSLSSSSLASHRVVKSNILENRSKTGMLGIASREGKLVSSHLLLPQTLKVIPPWFIMGKANHF